MFQPCHHSVAPVDTPAYAQEVRTPFQAFSRTGGSRVFRVACTCVAATLLVPPRPQLPRRAGAAVASLVSSTHGRASQRRACLQVQQSDDLAMGVRPALAARGVRGILNGLDTAAWDPATDPLLTPPMRFTPATAARGKAAAKAWLQARAGLPAAPRAPLVAFVGRLTDQKGVDVLLKALYKAAGPGALAQQAAQRVTAGSPAPIQVRCSTVDTRWVIYCRPRWRSRRRSASPPAPSRCALSVFFSHECSDCGR